MELRLALLFAVSFLFLAALSNAAGSIVVGCNTLSSSTPPVLPTSIFSVSLLALMISFDVVAIGYILSKIFANQGLSGWVNSEFWEMAKTAIIIVGVVAILSLLGNIALLLSPSQLVVQPSTSSYSTSLTALAMGACYYLAGVYSPGGYVGGNSLPGTNSYLANAYTYLLGLGNDIGTLKSIAVSVWIPIPPPPFAEESPVEFTFGFSMMPYQNRLLETDSRFAPQYASILNDMLTFVGTPVLLLMGMQYYLLPTVFTLGLLVVIPMGLVLRAFPFVRGIGGMLIALGIGMALIYPSLLLMLNYPITQALQSSAIPTLTGSTCNNLLCGFIIGLNGVGDALESVNSIFPALNGILFYNAYLLLQLVLFLLDLAIAFPLVDNIARMLGGSIRLQLGGKLKLR